MGEWQPIASAPLDGTRVRLGHDQVSGFAAKDPHGLGAVSGTWGGTRWLVSSYFIVPGGRYGMMTDVPTHWQPLPPPPDLATDGGE